MSNFFKSGKGRFIPNNSTIVVSLTLTTKFPRPGFSPLTTTFALFPTALTILFARVLNADHCLHASIVTVTHDGVTGTSSSSSGLPFFFGTLAFDFFLTGATVVDFGFSFPSSDGSFEEDRVVLVMTKNPRIDGRRARSTVSLNYL